MRNLIPAGRARLAVMALLFAAACVLTAGCTRAVEPKGVIYRPAEAEAEIEIEKPKHYTADEYEKMGDDAFRRDSLEFAFLNYEKALKLKPNRQNLRCKRAWVLLAGGFNKEAEQEFKAVLEKHADSAAAREGLGQAFFQLKRYDEAREQFKQAIALDARRWRSHNFLGITYNQAGDHARAIEEFKAALAVQPDSGILYNNLGMAYSMAGDYGEAMAAFNRAYELGAPHEKTLNNFGLALAKTGNVDGAREVFVEAGDEARAYNNLGCVYLARGDYEMALQSFEKAVSLAPDDAGTAEKNLKKCRRMMQ